MKKPGSEVRPTAKVPEPAPKTRNVPLPWQSPKAALEDKEAPARVAAILKSPGYLQADQDVAFLVFDFKASGFTL